MPHFKKYKLGELLLEKGYIRGPFGSALRRPEMKSSGHPVYEQQHAIYHSREFRFFIDDEKFDVLKRFQVKTNDLIISCSGTVGKISIIKEKDPKGIISQALLALRVNTDIISPKFLYYFFNTDYGFAQLLDASHGSVQANIAARHVVEEIELSLPDIIMQEKIISILSSLDDKIELNRRTNQTLEQIAQTLFKKYFVDDIDPENLPYGWRWGTLSEIIEFSNGYAFSSKELLDENKPNCYHVFKMGHIKRGGGLNSEGTKSFIEKSKTEGLEKYILRKGDLLMCMTDMKDSMALLGHTALMNENDKYIVNQRVGLIRARNELNIGHAFLYLLTNSVDFIEDLRSRANSGVQVNLSTNEIKQSRIVIPSKAINIEFQKNVDPIYEKIFQLAKENEKLVETRDSLLPKLMSGEIEVNAIEKELLDQ